MRLRGPIPIKASRHDPARSELLAAVTRLNHVFRFNHDNPLAYPYADDEDVDLIERWLHEMGHWVDLFKGTEARLEHLPTERGHVGSLLLERSIRQMPPAHQDANEIRAISATYIVGKTFGLDFDFETIARNAAMHTMSPELTAHRVKIEILHRLPAHRHARKVVRLLEQTILDERAAITTQPQRKPCLLSPAMDVDSRSAYPAFEPKAYSRSRTNGSRRVANSGSTARRVATSNTELNES